MIGINKRYPAAKAKSEFKNKMRRQNEKLLLYFYQEKIKKEKNGNVIHR